MTVHTDEREHPVAIPRHSKVVTAFGWVSLVLLLLTLFGAFIYAPQEAVQGIHQRIFYIHVPIAWIAFLAFFVVFVGSVGYLRTRSLTWDRIALASTEVGVVFTTLMLITGSLWARPIWGTWWTWDPKLTTSLILWFIYISYLMLRSYVAEPERAARYCAVVGLVGFVDVPIVYFSTTWWRALHPTAMIVTDSGPALPSSMLWVFILSLIAFNVLYIYLVAHRVRAERLKEALLDRLERLSADASPVPQSGREDLDAVERPGDAAISAHRPATAPSPHGQGG